MGKLGRHVLAPLLAGLGMVALYLTPKEAIGCANRGLAALALALLALVASIVMTALAVARRSASREESIWFVLSALLLVLPALLLLGPLG